MGYPTKVQRITRTRGTDQWYINVPTAIAEAAGFQKGERVEWEILDRTLLQLRRPEAPPASGDVKKKPRP